MAEHDDTATPIVGYEIGADVLRALGIDPHLHRIGHIQITIPAAALVTIELSYQPSMQQMEGVLSILRRYTLIALPDEVQAASARDLPRDTS